MGLPQGMSRRSGLEQRRFRQIPVQAAVGADLVSARRAYRQFIQGSGKFGRGTGQTQGPPAGHTASFIQGSGKFGRGTGRTQGPPLHANTGKLAEKIFFF